MAETRQRPASGSGDAHRELPEHVTIRPLPGLPVIFTSAHTRGVLSLNPDDPTVAFLEKPCTATGITQKVRAVLDARITAATPSR